jgi:DNA-binding NarL/FixJ family response regulator
MLMEMRIRVAIRHGDAVVAAGLQCILARHADIEVLDGSDYGTGAEVAVADYESALELVRRPRSPTGSGPAVLVLSNRTTEREIRHALERGVRGYLTQGCAPQEVIDAVRTLRRDLRYVGPVAAGRLAESICGEGLTKRELDVLRQVVAGHGNKAVANTLGVSAGTVKTHLKAIFQKLAVRTRTEAAALAERRGLLAIPVGPRPTMVATWSSPTSSSTSLHSAYPRPAPLPA